MLVCSNVPQMNSRSVIVMQINSLLKSSHKAHLWMWIHVLLTTGTNSPNGHKEIHDEPEQNVRRHRYRPCRRYGFLSHLGVKLSQQQRNGYLVFIPGVRYFLVLQTPESSSIIVSIGIRVCGHVSEGAGMISAPFSFFQNMPWQKCHPKLWWN